MEHLLCTGRKIHRDCSTTLGRRGERCRRVEFQLCPQMGKNLSQETEQQEASAQLLLLLLSRFSHVQLCTTPQTASHPAPPSLGFSRQEHWNGLPFPSPKQESESEIAQSCPTLPNPWIAAYQAPSSMGFSRQEHWSGVSMPSPKSTVRRVQKEKNHSNLSEKGVLGAGLDRLIQRLEFCKVRNVEHELLTRLHSFWKFLREGEYTEMQFRVYL